jgi:hypothetical protein
VNRTGRSWPFGYRLVVWYLGSLAAILLIAAALFLMNAAHG